MVGSPARECRRARWGCRAGLCYTRLAATRRRPKWWRWRRQRGAVWRRATPATSGTEADYTIGVVTAVEEVISRSPRQGGVVGVVSHMKALGPASWGLSKTLVGQAHRGGARARGVQVFADQYPYKASGTGIVGALMPRSAQVGGRDAMMKRGIRGELRNGGCARSVKTNIARRGGAETLMISRYAPDPSDRRQAASRIFAAASNTTPQEYRCGLLEKGKREPRVVQHVGRRHRAHHAPAVDDGVHGRRLVLGTRQAPPPCLRCLPASLKRYVTERRRHLTAGGHSLDDVAAGHVSAEGPRASCAPAPSPMS